MKRLWQRILQRLDGVLILLILTLIGGLLLRASGADFCLPGTQCHPDEQYLLNPALGMLHSGSFNPHLFVYPTLYIYLLLGVFCLVYLAGVSAGLWYLINSIKPAPFLLAGRLTTACLGTGTLLGVYQAGRWIFNPACGAVAALALAVMPLHVMNSHLVTTDVPAGFFSAMVLLACTRLACEGGKRSYLVAGLLVGLTAATKYNAALVLINIPLAHFINPRRQGFFDANLARALGWVVLGFVMGCPYALLDLPHFLEGVATEIAHYRRIHVGHWGEYNRLFYFYYLISHGFGPVLSGLGIYGLIEMVRRYRREHLLLLVFPLLYLLFIGNYKVRFVRNLMPVLPYFALWIGYGATQAFFQIRDSWPFWQRFRAWKVALIGLLIIITLPVAQSTEETLALVRPDARAEAREWIRKHIPPGKTLYMQIWSVDSLPPKMFNISDDPFRWDYFIATDRLSRKYFEMEKVYPAKYASVKEGFQHRLVALFEGRQENPFHYTPSPAVFIFARDPSRPQVKDPAAPAK